MSGGRIAKRHQGQCRMNEGNPDVPVDGDLYCVLPDGLGARASLRLAAAGLAVAIALASDGVAGLLDLYPNLYVDTSSREAELGRQPRAAGSLLTGYPERVLWGTDSYPLRPQQYRTWFRILETADEYVSYTDQAIPEQGRRARGTPTTSDGSCPVCGDRPGWRW